MTDMHSGLDSLRMDRATRRTRLGPRTKIFTIVVVVLAVATSWWWATQSEVSTVRTVVAKRRPATEAPLPVLNASGYVTARRRATVSSKVTGKVSAVLFEEGMRVHAGQVLARLDDSIASREVAVGEAQLDAARHRLAEDRVR